MNVLDVEDTRLLADRAEAFGEDHEFMARDVDFHIFSENGSRSNDQESYIS
jgi:hypothetical protein